MYKIKYLQTGHIFLLPENAAVELKEKYPEDYKILEKNGKKFRDVIKKTKENEDNSIYHKVVEEK
ncbi:MAG: hypothetical protein MJ230_07090 [bacterium]|nr:hypothetical protein [bacterium]